MAWIDDRAWCHPKLVGLTNKAWRVYFSSVAYSSGMGTSGVLSVAQQKLVGVSNSSKKQLIHMGLWDELSDGAVRIHDWDEHNGKRDERRRKDRERKRIERGLSAGHPQDAPVDARQDVHALKEVKVVKEVNIEPSILTSEVDGEVVNTPVERLVRLLGDIPEASRDEVRRLAALAPEAVTARLRETLSGEHDIRDLTAYVIGAYRRELAA